VVFVLVVLICFVAVVKSATKEEVSCKKEIEKVFKKVEDTCSNCSKVKYCMKIRKQLVKMCGKCSEVAADCKDVLNRSRKNILDCNITSTTLSPTSSINSSLISSPNPFQPSTTVIGVEPLQPSTSFNSTEDQKLLARINLRITKLSQQQARFKSKEALIEKQLALLNQLEAQIEERLGKNGTTPEVSILTSIPSSASLPSASFPSDSHVSASLASGSIASISLQTTTQVTTLP